MPAFIKVPLLLVLLFFIAVSNAWGYESLLEQARIGTASKVDCHSENPDTSQWVEGNFSLSPGQAYCLRVQVDARQVRIPDNPALIWSAMAAAEIYWDGAYLAANGQPASVQAREIPGNIEYLTPLHQRWLDSGPHTLSIWFSNHYQPQPLHQNLYQLALVDYDHYQHQSVLSYLPAVFLAGCLTFIALVLALIYGLYQKDSVIAWLILLASSCALLLWAESWRSLFGYTYPLHIIRLNLILWLAFIIAISLTGYYIRLYYPPRLWIWWLSSMALYLGIIITPLSYDFKVWAIFLLAILISLGICLSAFIKRKAGAKAALIFLLITTFLFVVLKMRFVEHWFAVVFGGLVLFNLYQLIQRFAQDRQRSLEADKLEAELLRRCLQPHFLMNSLTLAMEWVETDPEKSVSFITSLSREFQLLTEYSRKSRISLKDEIQLCKNYLDIMNARLQRNCLLHVKGEMASINLPPAIIHTLIENSFSHGGSNDDDFFIEISRHKGWIRLELKSPYGKSPHKGLGIGMQYIKAQLTRAFGDDWHMESREHNGQWQTLIEFPGKI